jgi:hypothetical protein
MQYRRRCFRLLTVSDFVYKMIISSRAGFASKDRSSSGTVGLKESYNLLLVYALFETMTVRTILILARNCENQCFDIVTFSLVWLTIPYLVLIRILAARSFRIRILPYIVQSRIGTVSTGGNNNIQILRCIVLHGTAARFF